MKDKFRYIVAGSLDDPDALPPRGEFFCKSRASWMPEIPGTCMLSVLEPALTKLKMSFTSKRSRIDATHGGTGAYYTPLVNALNMDT